MADVNNNLSWFSRNVTFPITLRVLNGGFRIYNNVRNFPSNMPKPGPVIKPLIDGFIDGLRGPTPEQLRSGKWIPS